MPTTIARMGLFLIPRRLSLSSFSLHASLIIVWMTFRPARLRASAMTV